MPVPQPMSHAWVRRRGRAQTLDQYDENDPDADFDAIDPPMAIDSDVNSVDPIMHASRVCADPTVNQAERDAEDAERAEIVESATFVVPN